MHGHGPKLCRVDEEITENDDAQGMEDRTPTSTWSIRKPNSRPMKTLHAAPAVAKRPSGSKTVHGGTAALHVGCWYLRCGRRHG